MNSKERALKIRQNDKLKEELINYKSALRDNPTFGEFYSQRIKEIELRLEK